MPEPSRGPLRCAVHGVPIHDATLCSRCTWDVERDLGDVPALVDELDLTLSRQTAIGYREGGRSAETALPFNVSASDVRDNLKATLVGWVRDLHEQTPDAAWPDDTAAACSRWLLARIGDIRVHPAGDQLRDEIGYAVGEARRIVDRPADRMYVGPCRSDVDGVICAEELYAKLGDDTIKCRACGTRHDTSERRAWLLAAVDDQLAHATLAARAVSGLGVDVTPERIRKWKERGRIMPHSVDREGRPLYRIEDVVALAMADGERSRRAS